MNIFNAPQGSHEWLAARATRFTASEAPAMMGASKYQTRADLLRQKATGITAEVDEHTQRRFDRGHAAEAAARAIVEDIIGDDLSPMTGMHEVEGLPLLASFDGVTLGRDIVWESKLWNMALVDQVRAGELEPHYYWQLEQQLLVSGAERAYFTTTDGTPENTVGMWYERVPGRCEQLIAGWKQFAEDLANYQHVEAAPEVTGRAPDALPALRVEVTGMVTASNIAEFKQHALAVLDKIKTDLKTDEDFANAEQTVRWCGDVEDRLKAVKQHALSQTASIDELFRAIDSIEAETRAKRIGLEKAVKARKEAIRVEIAQEHADAIRAHVAKLNERLGGSFMPTSVENFIGAMKGKKTVTSLRSACHDELTRLKLQANETADRIEANKKVIDAVDDAHIALFAGDLRALLLKDTEDLKAVVAGRIAAHETNLAAQRAREADDARREAERKEAERLALEAQAQAGEQASPAPAAVATPIQQSDICMSLNGAAGKSVPGQDAQPNDAMIDDFIRLLPVSAADKKLLRTHIQKWEKYRIARGLQEAA